MCRLIRPAFQMAHLLTLLFVFNISLFSSVPFFDEEPEDGPLSFPCLCFRNRFKTENAAVRVIRVHFDRKVAHFISICIFLSIFRSAFAIVHNISFVSEYSFYHILSARAISSRAIHFFFFNYFETLFVIRMREADEMAKNK